MKIGAVLAMILAAVVILILLVHGVFSQIINASWQAMGGLGLIFGVLLVIMIILALLGKRGKR